MALADSSWKPVCRFISEIPRQNGQDFFRKKEQRLSLMDAAAYEAPFIRVGGEGDPHQRYPL
jgi:hypothetical protein